MLSLGGVSEVEVTLRLLLCSISDVAFVGIVRERLDDGDSLASWLVANMMVAKTVARRVTGDSRMVL